MPGLTDPSRALLSEWQEIAAGAINAHIDRWAAGRISLADLEGLFKQEVKDLYIAAAWTARGSVEATSQADYGRVGRMLRDQYGFAGDFLGEIRQGNLSLAQVKARAGLYVSSSRQALEAVGAAQEGMPSLPAMPGDGSSICKAQCHCRWDIVKVAGGFDCTWVVTAGESCATCVGRAGKWNPLRVRFGKIVEG
jgi:hypothetical protein